MRCLAAILYFLFPGTMYNLELEHFKKGLEAATKKYGNILKGKGVEHETK